MLPFVVFDLREKNLLFFTVGFNLLVLLTFETTNAWVEMEVDREIFKTGYLATLSVILGTAICISFIYILLIQNRKEEKRSELLLEEAQEVSKKAAASQQELKENLEKLKSSQEEEKKRQWVAEGLAQATKILRQYDDISKLYDQLVSFVIKYVGANQAGLFLLEDEGSEPYLELKACFAYDRKKFLEKRISLGEGLLGQAYLEKEYIYMTDIPASYVSITSGLGQATPRNLLILPLKANETIEGILELASFDLLEQHEIQFLNTLGENIAATVRNVKINERTKVLLQESQQQTEEMRAQEEEMRQNMEELQATQEEMHRKQIELEQIRADLELKQQEVEKIRESEKARAEAKIETQKKSMNAVLEKMKEKEASYKRTIEEQEQIISELKSQINI